MATEIATLDQYIEAFPEDVGRKLNEIRNLIHKQAPATREHLFYKIPSITLRENQKAKDGLMFAAFKNHIGLYPKPQVIEHFQKEIKAMGLKYAEGTIQFPLNEPLPFEFISRIIEYKLSLNE